MLVSAVCLLYIMGFCQIAQKKNTKLWTNSSFIGLIFDLTVFEMLPSVLFGILVVLYFKCCKCIYTLIFAT